MTIYLHGPNTYKSKQKLREMVEEFKRKRDPSGLNVTEFDGGTVTLDQFRQATLTQSFLVNKRLAVIKDISQNKDRELGRTLLSLLQDKNFPSEDVVVIFWEGASAIARASRKTKSKGKTKTVTVSNSDLFDWLKEQKYVYEFKDLTPAELGRFVVQEVRERGGTITLGAAAKLISFVGNDLWQMSNEIAKLVFYKKAVDEASVALLVHAKVDENIFGLMDAVSQRDKKMAVRLYQEQVVTGAEPLYLHTMLVRQFRLLVEAQDFLSAHVGRAPTSEAFSETQGIHPFAAKKALAQARNFTSEEARSLYGELAEIEFTLKTSAAPADVLLTLFVVRAATRG